MKPTAAILLMSLLSTAAQAENNWEDSFPGNGIGIFVEQSGITAAPPPTPDGYPRFAELKIDQVPKYTEWYSNWLDIVGVGLNLTTDNAVAEKRGITFDLVLGPVLNELASDKCTIREIQGSDTIDTMVLDAFLCLKEQEGAE